MQEIFTKIIADPRYQANLDWGAPRSGHPEGTIRAHIAELEENLEALRPRLSTEAWWKLKILIHVHDTFKPEAVSNIAITDPRSHASLARQFLNEYCQDQDLLNMVQYHDEGHALFQQFSRKGAYSEERLEKLLGLIQDWDLFLMFNIIDGCTRGKDRKPLRWFIAEASRRVSTSVTPD